MKRIMKLSTILFGTIVFSNTFAMGLDIPFTNRVINKLNKRILGGTAATLQNHPSIAYFSVDGDTNNYCTGSLIGPNVVITAAHCLIQSGIDIASKWSLIKIGLGSVSPLPDNKNTYRYPFKNDLAILTLTECVPPSVATPIDIGEASDVSPYTFITSGFGFIEPNKPVRGNLMEVEVYKTDTDFCENYFPLSEIGKTALCIDQDTTNGVCFGDGGGPLLSKDYKKLIGVTSSIGVSNQKVCSADNTISTYTILSGYSNWIAKNTQCVGSSCSYDECESKNPDCDFSFSEVSVIKDSIGARYPVYQTDKRILVPCTSLNFVLEFDVDMDSSIYFLITSTTSSDDGHSIEAKIGFGNDDSKLGDTSFTPDLSSGPVSASATTHIKLVSTNNNLSVYKDGTALFQVNPNEYLYTDSLSSGQKYLYFAADKAVAVFKNIVVNCADPDGNCIKS
ncbi:Trypsin [Smittium culicis]|uniref:Trypsin n=1 Tax=Smittium culicis TaxID=133412 RepID=A0A1R1Y093_9FUNG|nr:Trypsin [Smittium culicis]